MSRYLLDTHTFLWLINNDNNLSTTAKTRLADADNTLYLSIASVWEMAIKRSINKLDLPDPFVDFIDEQLHKNRIELLHIQVAHMGSVATLPFHHRDPFDRLLIAQAQHEKIPIIGRDVIFDKYDVTRYW